MEETPVTMDEWQEYVDGIPSDERLYEEATRAGSLKFGQRLLTEGYSAEEITAIRTMFAVRMVDEDVAPPGRVDGNITDYRKLADFPF